MKTRKNLTNVELQRIYVLYDSGLHTLHAIHAQLNSPDITEAIIRRVLQASDRSVREAGDSRPSSVLQDRLKLLRARLGLPLHKAAARGSYTLDDLKRAEDPRYPVDLNLIYRIVRSYGANFREFLQGTAYDE